MTRLEQEPKTKTEGLTWQDIAEAAARLKQLELERDKQMRFEEAIRDAVLICSMKNKHIIKSAIPSLCVVTSDYCKDDVCYMVTDKELAEQLREVARGTAWMPLPEPYKEGESE